ncbi:FAD-dependent oxidoreductase [Candidatus Woesearchaeota archaeon]|nr:FAD-dependent oxidoreductase [Candidatus Woesearchaeota archaeon]
MEFNELTCVRNEEYGHNQHVLSFKEPLSFEPGHYVTVFFEGMKPAPFSLASAPGKPVQLAVEIVGAVTTKLSEMKPGDKVKVKGPFGRFVLGNEEKSCFIAGGIGIAPFMSMLRASEHDMILLYSCKDQNQILWHDELDSMTDNISVNITLTRAKWNHITGRVSQETIKKYVPDYLDRVFYVCGPLTMINELFEMLAGLGVSKDNLKREVWYVQ